MAQEGDSIIILEPVEIRATRAGIKSPFTQSNLNKREIEQKNLGRDLPFMISNTPSVIVHSDAGNGIGYTGLRIRGSDPSRINVTINGIPFNDAESQGSFFVDMPDILSSVSSIQIQRGVGTSSNGPGAFGATVNISTNELIREAYAEINNSFGSFNSWKHTIMTGSGLINKKFFTDFRISRITSDGYIDRADSRLNSYFFATGLLLPKGTIRFNHFSGKEKTYQAWYGVHESDMLENRRINYAGTEKPGAPYDNETDNYKQDHFQLFFDQKLQNRFRLGLTLFYIKGKGFYEQYKADQDYEDYGMAPPANVATTDLVRQLWLDNDFYGTNIFLEMNSPIWELTTGLNLHNYEGLHFGDVIWAKQGLPFPSRWYHHDAQKRDLTAFIKQSLNLTGNLSIFLDLQLRSVNYEINGFRDNPEIVINNAYKFFNPKIGMNYSSGPLRVYASFARAQKEPNRDDFETGLSGLPRPEKLNDYELGFEVTKKRLSGSAAFYYMNYKDQLALNGKINDVGAYTRINIPKSYRLGIEIAGAYTLNERFSLSGNLALSRNRINNFVEYIDDYDNGGQIIYEYHNTDISFSPSVISNLLIEFKPVPNGKIGIQSKYVGEQFLDNTSNPNRKLDAYFVNDLSLMYSFRFKPFKNIAVQARLNNIFDHLYEPNGYTYSYYSGGALETENYYYPMAGRNFMFAINLRL